MYVAHFLIHPPINGQLDCFHFLATVNDVTIKMGVQISLQASAFNSFGYICRNGIAGWYNNYIFNFLRTATLFSIVAVSFYIPTKSAQGFQFLHIFGNTSCFLDFDSSHPNGYEVGRHLIVVRICISPTDKSYSSFFQWHFFLTPKMKNLSVITSQNHITAVPTIFLGLCFLPATCYYVKRHRSEGSTKIICFFTHRGSPDNSREQLSNIS